jgi:hypothetical protein
MGLKLGPYSMGGTLIGVFENRMLRRIFGSKRRKLPTTAEDCIMRIFIIVRSPKYYGDQVNEGVMGGACSTHGRDEKCIHYFDLKTWREETTRKT